MNRKLATAIVTFALLASSLTPAKAVFGLSKCEKVKKEIQAEEAVGKESWKDFDQQRDRLIANGYLTNSQTNELMSLLLLVTQSDLSVKQISVKNIKCFDNKTNATNRKNLASTMSDIKLINEFLSVFSKNRDRSSIQNKPAYTFLKDYYQKFYSIYDK
jgi:hypothetical protein